MFKYILFISFTLSQATLLARTPAVEPVSGISIEEYQEVEPTSDPGYNWNQSEKYVKSFNVSTRIPAQKNLISETSNQTTSMAVTFVLVALLGLPFGLWYFVMNALDKRSSEEININQTPSVSENTYSLDSARKEKEMHEKEKYDKAS